MEAIEAVILAAGFSRRHPVGDKLLRAYRGKPLILHVVETVCASSFRRVLVVVQDTESDLATLVHRCEVELVQCLHAGDGMGASLAAGVASVSDDRDGVAIFLGDMPEIKPRTVALLKSRFASMPTKIVRPVFEGAAGHPVIFPARLFADLKRLSGDVGARDVIRQQSTTDVVVDDRGVIFDLDDVAAFEANR